MRQADKEDLYRRLAQSRRLAADAPDPTTKQRLQQLISDIEDEIALAEAKDADAPPE